MKKIEMVERGLANMLLDGLVELPRGEDGPVNFQPDVPIVALHRSLAYCGMS